ncbi:hypothetical protein BDV24DRAFT_127496 [Aspergillus arachidicola]|uniref:Uncharacterized protein n=1 Tax=Aspergillus arachidicola TaxID=656916 RepID=A0A5N6YFB9_9EURO|nr:hypothetical protein BDV24DRAFT_127496 [Aspergillus arachidicola]
MYFNLAPATLIISVCAATVAATAAHGPKPKPCGIYTTGQLCTTDSACEFVCANWCAYHCSGSASAPYTFKCQKGYCECTCYT